MEHKELTEKIIACAYRFFNAMGSGFLESVYEKCMVIELKRSGFNPDIQRPINVFYEGEPVGDFVADIIVDNKIIIELKAVRQLTKAHEVQLVNYLAATGISVGLLMNFGEERVEVKRKLRILK